MTRGVYMVIFPDSVKIGCSMQVERRLYGAGNALRPALACVMFPFPSAKRRRDVMAYERTFHQRFASTRIVGEQFGLSSELIETFLCGEKVVISPYSQKKASK